jgi:hypothetical protein
MHLQAACPFVQNICNGPKKWVSRYAEGQNGSCGLRDAGRNAAHADMARAVVKALT